VPLLRQSQEGGDIIVSSEFWGMTGFFITTIIFSATTLIYSRKLYQTRQLLRQLKEKANQSHSDY
tara:strand:+ start:2657 stop:2851 length:195 start_codon:yes stop_codon:yes gene_type:complete